MYMYKHFNTGNTKCQSRTWMKWSVEQRYGESWHNVDDNDTLSTSVILFPVGVGTMYAWRKT